MCIYSCKVTRLDTGISETYTYTRMKQYCYCSIQCEFVHLMIVLIQHTLDWLETPSKKGSMATVGT